MASLIVLRTKIACLLAVSVFSFGRTEAQGPPPMRRHTTTESKPLTLVPANQDVGFPSEVSIEVQGQYRIITVNGIPDHAVGQFPNSGNPNTIAVQPKVYRVPVSPVVPDRTARQSSARQSSARRSRSRRAQTNNRPEGPPPDFGIAVNGVLFDPGAAEFWKGNPESGWAYDALGGAVALGIDANHAHVQPGGKYHYHGLPTGLMKQLGHQVGSHSPLIGWAADGFPIYAQFGYKDPNDPRSGVKELLSAYRLKKGRRKSSSRDTTSPDGNHDGAFVNDYEFVSAIGDLDECNGRQCVTPEFPEGTYAYFLTSEFPVVPRQNRGTADPSFEKRMGGPSGSVPPGGAQGFGPPGFGPPGGPPGGGRPGFGPPPGGGPAPAGPPGAGPPRGGRAGGGVPSRTN
ncbi:MAG: YHYH protein [Fuerstiella sp.]